MGNKKRVVSGKSFAVVVNSGLDATAVLRQRVEKPKLAEITRLMDRLPVDRTYTSEDLRVLVGYKTRGSFEKTMRELGPDGEKYVCRETRPWRFGCAKAVVALQEALEAARGDL